MFSLSNPTPAILRRMPPKGAVPNLMSEVDATQPMLPDLDRVGLLSLLRQMILSQCCEEQLETILISVGKTGRLLIVDESFQPCGIGAEIAAQVIEHSFDDLDAPIRRLNGAHVPTPYSPPLETAVVPQVDTIVESVLSLMANR